MLNILYIILCLVTNVYSLSQLNSFNNSFHFSRLLWPNRNGNKSFETFSNNSKSIDQIRRNDIWEQIYGQIDTEKSVLEEQLSQMTSWLSDRDTIMVDDDTPYLNINTNAKINANNEELGLAEPLKAEKLKAQHSHQASHQTNKQTHSQTQATATDFDKKDESEADNHNDETQEEDSGPAGSATKIPACAHLGRFYCSYKEDYPTKVVTEVTKYYKWPLEKLFRDLRHQVMPTLANDNTGGLVCDSITRIVRPGWSKNTNGRWLVVINTDYYQQYVTEVICRHGSGSYCNYIPPCYHASCAQRYNTQKLLVIDPWNPYKGPFLSEFLYPSCCICFIASSFETTPSNIPSNKDKQSSISTHQQSQQSNPISN